MIKLLFLVQSELEEAVSEIIKQKQGKSVKCCVDYSETFQADVVKLQSSNEQKEILIKDLLNDLSNWFDVNITSYDVFEIGDYGEGFAFFIA